MIKKRRSSGKKSATTGSRRKSLAEKQHKLHAQIGKLEEFIASSPFQERKHRIDTRDIIPPPERSRKSSPKGKKRMSRKHKLAARQERHRHLFNFFCLFLILCALLYWLFRPAFSM